MTTTIQPASAKIVNPPNRFFSLAVEELRRQLTPVGNIPPTQCVREGFIRPNKHEFLLNYYRWHLRIVVTRDQKTNDVTVAASLRPSGTQGSWKAVYQTAINQPADHAYVQNLLVQISGKLWDRAEVRRVVPYEDDF